MKKVLLSAALGLLTISGAMAITDGQTYEEVNGLNIVNKWVISRVHTGELAYSALPIANNYARSAVMSKGTIYVARTCAIDVTVPGDTAMQSAVYKYDAETGEFIGEMPLTINGAPYKANAASSLLFATGCSVTTVSSSNTGISSRGNTTVTFCSGAGWAGW